MSVNAIHSTVCLVVVKGYGTFCPAELRTAIPGELALRFGVAREVGQQIGVACGDGSELRPRRPSRSFGLGARLGATVTTGPADAMNESSDF
jgi:hypothetical protein